MTSRTKEAKIVFNRSILLTGLSCLGFLLSACTTTYRESDLGKEPLDEPVGEGPNCSILADEPGCELENPFDP